MIWRESKGILPPRQVGIYMSVRHRTSVWIPLRKWCGLNASSGESRRITVVTVHLVTFTEDGDNVFTVLSNGAPLELSCLSSCI